MAELQIFEGTTEDIAKLLQNGAFAGSKLKLIVDPAPIAEGEEEDLSDSLPDPPNTIRDRAHLEELLLEGINSPKHPVTDQEWIDIRREVRERLAKKSRTYEPDDCSLPRRKGRCA